MHLGYECFFLSNLVTLGLGSFILALTAIKDIKQILRSMNDQCTKNRSRRKRLEAVKQLREFVQMHAALKELRISRFHLISAFPFKSHSNINICVFFSVFGLFSSIAQPIIMFLFAWSLAAVCAGLLVVTIALVQ